MCEIRRRSTLPPSLLFLQQMNNLILHVDNLTAHVLIIRPYGQNIVPGDMLKISFRILVQKVVKLLQPGCILNQELQWLQSGKLSFELLNLGFLLFHMK